MWMKTTSVLCLEIFSCNLQGKHQYSPLKLEINSGLTHFFRPDAGTVEE